MTGLYIVLALAIAAAALVGVWMQRNRRERRLFVMSIEQALQQSFRGEPLPKLTVGFMYNFPSFRLEFASRERHQAAADSGAVARFMTEVQRLCSDRGTNDNAFDVHKSIYFTDPEQEKALSKWAEEERKKFDGRDGGM